MYKKRPMALQDRIRQILQDMDGPDYGKRARLAKIAKCGKPVVTHWLNGQGKINTEHAMNIANGLNYRMEWITEGKGPRRKGETETVEFSDEESGEELKMIHVSLKELDILNAYRMADPMDRSVIEHLCLKTLRAAAKKN